MNAITIKDHYLYGARFNQEDNSLVLHLNDCTVFGYDNFNEEDWEKFKNNPTDKYWLNNIHHEFPRTQFFPEEKKVYPVVR